MTTRSTEISVTAPVGQALDWVKRMLFQPFDLGKWFVIGFCAWLAGLGESGTSFHGGGGSGGGGAVRRATHRASAISWTRPRTT